MKRSSEGHERVAGVKLSPASFPVHFKRVGLLETNSLFNKTLNYWSCVVKLFSFEWLLTRTKLPNGGDIILLRALLIASLIYFVILVVLQIEINQPLQWFGATFAAIYFALYARFASQWTYLANLYNQIKAAEARSAQIDAKASNPRIVEWKAGFLEDAQVLHLATKDIFVPVLKVWGEDSKVEKAFVKYSPGHQKRFDALRRDVNYAYHRQEKKFA